MKLISEADSDLALFFQVFPRRVLVTGGRDYDNAGHRLWIALRGLANEEPIDLIVHGGATGADTWAQQWAVGNGVAYWGFALGKREWSTYGLSAGHKRNQIMHDITHPAVVVAAPGGKGTASMVAIAKKAGTRVLEVR